MKAATGTDNWRDKYFDSLSRLESEQARFQSIEAALKRVAGRLCTASLGQSGELDRQLKKLQALMRGDPTSEALDSMTSALTDAIRDLDHDADGSVKASIGSTAAVNVPANVLTDDTRIRDVLSSLLTQLRSDSALASQVEVIDAQLSTALAADRLSRLLGDIAEVVSQRIKRIESAKQEVELLLTHMVGKLDEIGQFVAEQTQSQTESQASNETLSVQLVGEMKAIGESVEAASDLQQIRSQVRTRLESIEGHLQAFRHREATLAAAMRSRSEQMQVRIVALENEAKRLEAQLSIEQQQSTFDVLTKIPNRLAYDKRIDEELKRFRRFKQPTCLAVWDVDNFKRINDTYGHRAGDRVLSTVAEFLSRRMRATDFVARYGGEEFVTILPGTPIEDAARVIDQLRAAIAMIGFHFRGAPVSVTISGGITSLQAHDSAGAAFDRADKALYQAKANGRNQCVTA